jgi:hypothetical protein
MRTGLRRIGQDLKGRRHLDAYVVAAISFVFAILSIVGDVVPDELRWAALLAGVGMLVYRITLPDGRGGLVDDLLSDRTEFDEKTLAVRLKSVREVWVFAPSAVNILSAHHCELLRRGPLGRPDGAVRVVVLDPDEAVAVKLAVRQLDDSLDYPVQEFRSSLETTLRQLHLMARWPPIGSLAYRLLDYNPGFSLVALDPSARHGRLIVEFHAFHNEATGSRMHLELTRRDSERWYSYWIEQFDRVWQAARSPSSESATGDAAGPQ